MRDQNRTQKFTTFVSRKVQTWRDEMVSKFDDQGEFHRGTKKVLIKFGLSAKTEANLSASQSEY
jgi:hypothetical protein